MVKQVQCQPLGYHGTSCWSHCPRQSRGGGRSRDPCGSSSAGSPSPAPRRPQAWLLVRPQETLLLSFFVSHFWSAHHVPATVLAQGRPGSTRGPRDSTAPGAMKRRQAPGPAWRPLDLGTFHHPAGFYTAARRPAIPSVSRPRRKVPPRKHIRGGNRGQSPLAGPVTAAAARRGLPARHRPGSLSARRTDPAARSEP